ncbi:MAG: hypothetical protein DME34_08660 [Verrucomicrobia bacterium]|nr:MAG: hypothetical protein DME34_08660 [Verrucomicrobiota bacterium]
MTAATAPKLATDFDALVRKRVRELRPARGLWRKAYWHASQCFFTGPRSEIAHDWEIVTQFAERARQRFTDDSPTDTQKHDLVEVLALLKCARKETDFAQAWTYVNSADAMLPLIVDEDELYAAVVRLRTADERLPNDYQQRLVDALAKTNPPAPQKAQPKHQPPQQQAADSKKERLRLHREQLARTLLWNTLNRHISLKLSLWRAISTRLSFALLAFFGALAIRAAFASAMNPRDQTWSTRFFVTAAPFFEIMLLGFFGGMLSAFLTARDAEVNVPSYEVLRTRASLRMLLGGAGAVVVYSVGLWLFSEKLQSAIDGSIYVFITVGIVAGFSERLFIDALERAGQNLRLTGSPSQAEQTPSSTRPAKARGHTRGTTASGKMQPTTTTAANNGS